MYSADVRKRGNDKGGSGIVLPIRFFFESKVVNWVVVFSLLAVKFKRLR